MRAEGRMSRGDNLSGTFWLAISLVAAMESYRLGLGHLHAPQAGFLPFVASLLLGALSVSLLITTPRTTRSGSEGNEDVTFNVHQIPKVLYALVSLFLYGLLLEVLGFLVASVLLMTFLLRVIEPQKWYVVTFGAILIPVCALLLFERGLGVVLPKGVLGF
jgi:putative tricarboxylic transport membrane protein